MRTTPTLEFIFVIALEPRLGVHVDSVNFGSDFDKRKIETITVVGGHDCWLGIANVLEPLFDDGCLYRNGLTKILLISKQQLTYLIRFIEDYEFSFIFILGRILEILDIFADNFSIRDQEPLAVNHVRNHHDLIGKLIRKLEWLFGSFDIVRHNDRFGSLDTFRDVSKRCRSAL
jgi:hypothetical protein